MTLSYQVESITVIRDEGDDLLHAHWQEIAAFKNCQKLDPDWATYEKMEAAGRLWTMTARNEQGRLVGYIVMGIAYSLHYKGLLSAAEDVHFLERDYRKGMAGYFMLRFMIKAMRERGVKFLSIRTKAARSHEILFKRLGMTMHDIVYSMEL